MCIYIYMHMYIYILYTYVSPGSSTSLPDLEPVENFPASSSDDQANLRDYVVMGCSQY